jgi:dienelactone hydrolase
LTETEATDLRRVFDIDLLAGRLGGAIEWLDSRDDMGDLPLGLFGASTGAAAALVAAARKAERVAAVVSRGGRPDLAGDALERVEAATLLIVGGSDPQVVALNREAFSRMHCVKAIEIIPGATHLFEEPGALEQVAALGRDWFLAHAAAP